MNFGLGLGQNFQPLLKCLKHTSATLGICIIQTSSLSLSYLKVKVPINSEKL